MKFTKNPLFYLNLVLIFALAFQVLRFVYAWSEPTAAFPGGAPAAPLDTGPGAQTKSGDLSLGGKLNIFSGGSLAYYLSGTGICLLESANGTTRACKQYWDQIGVGWIKNGSDIYTSVSGNVGIGTTNPSQKLEVAGTVKATAFQGDGSGLTNLPSGSQWTNTTNGIAYDVSGKGVAIGLGDPGTTYKLNIDGTAHASGGWESASDARLKTNVEQLTGVLDKLQEINAVRFDWKNLSGGRQIGLIAQEVEKHFPELVSTGSDGYKSLAYDRLTAVLLQAIKEQQAQINDLNARLSRLESR